MGTGFEATGLDREIIWFVSEVQVLRNCVNCDIINTLPPQPAS